MLKQLTQQELFRFFDKISEEYQLLVPQILEDGIRGLLPWDGEHIALTGELLQRKPTCHFFPQTDLLVRLDSEGQADSQHEKTDKPLALCGLNREDLHGINFIDRFFFTEPIDDIYLSNRENALLIGLTGYSGPDQSFLPLAENLCDIELIYDQENWLAAAYTELGKKWLSGYSPGSNKRIKQLHLKSSPLIDQRQELVSYASQLLRAEQVPDSFWKEISARCIRCGGCNFSCPTCTCFCVQDRGTTTGIERSRIWDSCQLDAFMREASGHNPLGTDMLRTRRRIHHKLVDDPLSWGEFGCIFCGRCDRACPTGIGMFAICEEIVRRFGNGNS